MKIRERVDTLPQQAIPLLERTHEWYWLGEVHFWFAFISIRLGSLL